MNAPMRRGACPALSAPMATGDGLLVRLNPVAAGLSPSTLAGLCEAAGRHGNGIVEVTARGSFQIRGLSGAAVAELAAEVDALGIVVRTGVPVETGPLAGLEPGEIADPAPLADAIHAGIAAAAVGARLGPKVSVVVDGGGAPWMAHVAADVRLTAFRGHAVERDPAAQTVWHLAVASDGVTAKPLADLTATAARDAALAILGAVADLGRDARARNLSMAALHRLTSAPTAEPAAPHSFTPPSGLPAISPSRGEIEPAARLSPITNVAGKALPPKLPISPLEGEMAGKPEGGAQERNATREIPGEAVDPSSPSPVGLAALRLIGQHRLIDFRTALAVALPFGQVEARRLAAFLAEAERLGAAEIRLAPRRALILICGDADAASAVQAAADAAGLIVDSHDPRLFISACPGAPACASGKIETRALAEDFAAAHGDMLDGSIELHVSGCAKGCAHPAPAALAIVGAAAETGTAVAAGEPPCRAALVANGTASSRPLAHIAAGGATAALARVAALVRAGRRPGEATAEALARLGPKKLAAAFAQEPR